MLLVHGAGEGSASIAGCHDVGRMGGGQAASSPSRVSGACLSSVSAGTAQMQQLPQAPVF